MGDEGKAYSNESFKIPTQVAENAGKLEPLCFSHHYPLSRWENSLFKEHWAKTQLPTASTGSGNPQEDFQNNSQGMWRSKAAGPAAEDKCGQRWLFQLGKNKEINCQKEKESLWTHARPWQRAEVTEHIFKRLSKRQRGIPGSRIYSRAQRMSRHWWWKANPTPGFLLIAFDSSPKLNVCPTSPFCWCFLFGLVIFLGICTKSTMPSVWIRNVCLGYAILEPQKVILNWLGCEC